MIAATPPPAAWDRALEGLRSLDTKIDALAENQRQLQAQLTDVRGAYTRAAPMASLMQLEGRVQTLESGATAAILRRLDDGRAADTAWREAEQADRGARRKAQDLRDWLLLGLLAGILLAVLGLIGVLIWLGVR